MTEEDDVCTLRVRHLPPGLTDERRVELFQHYGAVKTRTIRKSAKYTITFVEFPSKAHAEEVFVRLHQLPVKGKRLSIEFAKRNVSNNKENDVTNDEETAKEEAELLKCKENFKKFINKLNTWIPHGELNQPIPPNLAYKYPNPTKMTLLRIAIQLKKEPAFYTQVLHLMNKMCLPPPFEELDEKYPQLKEFYDVENYKDLFDVTVVSQRVDEEVANEDLERSAQELEQLVQEAELSEDDESEIESDETSGPQMIIPEKRKKSQPKRPVKIPKFINPLKQPAAPTNSNKKQKPKDVFERPVEEGSKRKIDLKISIEPTNKSNVEEVPFVVQSGSTEGFGLILPRKEIEGEEQEKKQDCITTDQLESNKISTHDQRLLPVFKNYHPGIPSNRLYLKNLSKQVDENDLHFIYKRYVRVGSTGIESEYNVRLMQEGRMKGQAFVTFPTVCEATIALKETNGYILKDKPMVVQFAKANKNSDHKS